VLYMITIRRSTARVITLIILDCLSLWIHLDGWKVRSFTWSNWPLFNCYWTSSPNLVLIFCCLFVIFSHFVLFPVRCELTLTQVPPWSCTIWAKAQVAILSIFFDEGFACIWIYTYIYICMISSFLLCCRYWLWYFGGYVEVYCPYPCC
jgi:hypothetical protein